MENRLRPHPTSTSAPVAETFESSANSLKCLSSQLLDYFSLIGMFPFLRDVLSVLTNMASAKAH